MPWQTGSRRAVGSDERLAARAGRGDDRAFAAIYERYHQGLFRYCLSILRDQSDAQDALQSTFERALSALQRGRRNAPLRPWLFRIAHNEAITVIRRRSRDQEPEHLGTGYAQSAEHVAGERDRLATLVADLGRLPERPRSALIMRELEGLSHEEIAVALQTSVGAAKQAIFEARRALADAAEGRAMTCAEIRRMISDDDRRVLRGRRMRAHLHSCAPCAEFAGAISQRRADLRALAPPLAPLAAVSILARLSAGLGGHGARGGLSVAATGSGSVGKGALAAAVGSKAAVGAAVIATATAGVAGIDVLRTQAHPSPAARSSVAMQSAHSRAASVAHGASSRAPSAAYPAASEAAQAGEAAQARVQALAALAIRDSRIAAAPAAPVPATTRDRRSERAASRHTAAGRQGGTAHARGGGMGVGAGHTRAGTRQNSTGSRGAARQQASAKRGSSQTSRPLKAKHASLGSSISPGGKAVARRRRAGSAATTKAPGQIRHGSP